MSTHHFTNKNNTLIQKNVLGNFLEKTCIKIANSFNWLKLSEFEYFFELPRPARVKQNIHSDELQRHKK